MTAGLIPSGLPTPRAEYRLTLNGRVTGDCPACGKERFETRKSARRAGRKVRSRHLNAYRCGNFWHYGGLDPAVIQGRMTRDGRPNPDLVLPSNPTVAAQIRSIWAASKITQDPNLEGPHRDVPEPAPADVFAPQGP